MPVAVSIVPLAKNTVPLASAWATVCRVAASSPTASSAGWCRLAPASATPKPVRISPAFSTLE